LDYSKPSTQARVKEILGALTNSSRFVSSDYGENWLTSFNDYVERYGELYEYNITTEEQFIHTLRTEYFPNNIFAHDVTFNENGTKIIASRFILQLVDTWGSEEAKEAIVNLREVAAAQTDMEVVLFNPWLAFVDQFILIRPLTIQLLSIAAAIVMVVAVIFIPNLVTSLCVFFTIVSTEWGVLGLMALWGVSLDMISIMCLIMCIGFSVDVRKLNKSTLCRS
jgi:predicted RND superfamily exporter protein